MTQLNDLASRLLKFEQQLTAYQKLHDDELAELWRVLNECKHAVITALPPSPIDGHSQTSLVVNRQLRSQEK